MVKKNMLVLLILFMAIGLFADVADIANAAVNEPSVVAKGVDSAKNWIVGLILNYKTTILLAFLTWLLKSVITKFLGGLYEQWVKFSNDLKVKHPNMDALLGVVDKLVLAETGALMSVAETLKEAAADGKLTEIEKARLRQEVKEKVISALKVTYPDLGQAAITVILKYIDSATDWKVEIHKGNQQ